MSRISRALLVAGVALAVLEAASALRAREPRAVPEFRLSTSEDLPARSADLLKGGRHLLVYLRAPSRAALDLLEFLDKDVPPAFRGQILLIAGPGRATAQVYKSRYPSLAKLPWYLDGELDVWKALEFTCSPSVLGLEDRTIRWRLDGLLPDPSVWKTVLRQWAVGSEPKAAGAPAAVTPMAAIPGARPGDCDGDDRVDIWDAIRLLAFLFQGGTTVSSPVTCDDDGSKGLDLNDAVYLLRFLFQSGPAPQSQPVSHSPGPETRTRRGSGPRPGSLTRARRRPRWSRGRAPRDGGASRRGRGRVP